MGLEYKRQFFCVLPLDLELTLGAILEGMKKLLLKILPIFILANMTYAQKLIDTHSPVES